MLEPYIQIYINAKSSLVSYDEVNGMKSYNDDSI